MFNSKLGYFTDLPETAITNKKLWFQELSTVCKKFYLIVRRAFKYVEVFRKLVTTASSNKINVDACSANHEDKIQIYIFSKNVGSTHCTFIDCKKIFLNTLTCGLHLSGVVEGVVWCWLKGTIIFGNIYVENYLSALNFLCTGFATGGVQLESSRNVDVKGVVVSVVRVDVRPSEVSRNTFRRIKRFLDVGRVCWIILNYHFGGSSDKYCIIWSNMNNSSWHWCYTDSSSFSNMNYCWVHFPFLLPSQYLTIIWI